MDKYTVTGYELKSVADAIRSKGGTNEPLVFPDGFSKAVENISVSAKSHIYGVSWDMSDSTKLTRTDDAADFADPVPFVAGASEEENLMNAIKCGSPFDTLYPWAGMGIVRDALGELVSIPKYWYKITKTDTELKIQIADAPVDGFSVSPAHMDRGDGKGERDIVYVARYKSGGDMLQSLSGQSPVIEATKSDIRNALKETCAGLQEEFGKTVSYPMQDYAMFWTIRMLYLVEYADWDSQAAIGYGCGTAYEHESMCQTCNGTGQITPIVECSSCYGTGTVTETCGNCGGTGFVTEESQCYNCMGSGFITTECSSCGGSGVVGDDEACSICGGNGTVDEPCEVCGGRGIVQQQNLCPVCGGNGNVEKQCESCGGTGQVEGDLTTCSDCNGTGLISISIGQKGPLNTGTTDSMPYHTGTMQTSRDEPGQGVQYRYIEDLWAGLFEYVDGIRFDNDGNVYITMNPSDYSDTEGGTLVGNLLNCITNGSGWIAGWDAPSVDGYNWAMLPIEGSEFGLDETGKRVSDILAAVMSSNESNTLLSGGCYVRQFYNAGEMGLFCFYGAPQSNAVQITGVRLQKLV